MRTYLLALMLLLSLSIGQLNMARASPSAAVQNDSMWIDSAGMLHIFGEVKNTGGVWLQFVKIVGTLRDSSDAIVDVGYTYTRTMYLPPEGVSPFDLTELDTAKSARVQSYSLIVEYREVAPIPQKLVILNTADSKNSLGWLEIVGEVENQADQVSTYTKIVGTFYDETGKIIYTAYTYTDPSEVPAGAKHPFKMMILNDERSSKISRYTLIAESMNSHYTSVPEWPFPGVILVAVLGLASLLIGRARRFRRLRVT